MNDHAVNNDRATTYTATRAATLPGEGLKVETLTSQEIPWLPIESLLPADSPRLHGESATHVEMLARLDASLPPILVHRPTMRVIDGMHRLRAAALRNQRLIATRFFEGDQDDAFILAVATNRAHGLPLTLTDRASAAARIIRAHPHRSDRWVAALTGLAARTVSEIRRRTDADASRPQVRIGRDGRVRPLNAAEGRRAASELIARRPDATLREIARVAGISLGTARDVRERLRRGEDPLPPTRRGDRDHRPVATVTKAEPDVRPDAETCAGLDPAEMLQNLRNDPSLRFTESGRRLLQWLHLHAVGPVGWEDVVAGAPPHCAYVLADLASACAREWSLFGMQLRERLLDSA